MSERIFKTEEVAKILNVSLPTLRRLTHNQTIKGFKLGREIRYRESDVFASLKEITKPQKLQTHG